jgi:hypothetical protein
MGQFTHYWTESSLQYCVDCPILLYTMNQFLKETKRTCLHVPPESMYARMLGCESMHARMGNLS